MVSEEKTHGVAQIRAGRLDPAARIAYAKAFDAKRDTSGGLDTMDDCLSNAQLFEVVVDGQIVCRYALQQATRAKGTEVFIVAAAGALPGISLVESVAPYIERQCAEADRLTINTRRRGLVKKLLQQGWTLDSFVMRKKIK